MNAARWWRHAKPLLQAVFLAVLLLFVARYIAGQWASLRDTATLQVHWPLLMAAQVGTLIGLALLPLGAWLTLRFVGLPLEGRIVWRAFFVSNMAKYLPGSIWALPGRAFLYQRNQLTVAASITIVVWEVALMCAGAGVVALLSLRLIQHYIPAIILLVGVLFAVMIGSGVLLLLKTRAQTLLVRVFPHALRLTLPQMMVVALAYCISWICIGLSFACLVAAVSPELAPIHWFELTGLYSGAWLVGFLAFFAPGGIGVRDGLLTLGVGVLFAPPLPLVTAILARLMWTLAELAGLLLSGLLLRDNPLEAEAEAMKSDERGTF